MKENCNIRFFCIFRILAFALVPCASANSMDFSISKTWDSRPSDHDPIVINLSDNEESVILSIRAPFFNDPPAPEGEPGKPFHKLWEYEVVEAFFLGAEENYLEVEFSPHGQHLLLLLSGRSNAIKMCLPVKYTATIHGDKWQGVAEIPKSYFPPRVNLFNAYAIHGSDERRQYEALFPVPTGHFEHPNFHRIEFFRYVDFKGILPTSSSLSDVWKEALKNSGKELKCE